MREISVQFSSFLLKMIQIPFRRTHSGCGFLQYMPCIKLHWPILAILSQVTGWALSPLRTVLPITGSLGATLACQAHPCLRALPQAVSVPNCLTLRSSTNSITPLKSLGSMSTCLNALFKILSHSPSSY
jgi:hypothetical protein